MFYIILLMESKSHYNSILDDIYLFIFLLQEDMMKIYKEYQQDELVSINKTAFSKPIKVDSMFPISFRTTTGKTICFSCDLYN